LITGITGQDGSYLAEFLLEKGYEVFGTVRRTSRLHDENIHHLLDRVTLLDADLVDQQSITQAIQVARPDEVYNLAAMSFVGVSFKQPIATVEYTGASVVRVLEAVRQAQWPIRFYQASTSEMFGKVQTVPQNEATPFYPRSPYAASKLFGHWTTVNYRESYSMFACSGILFNHECVTAETPVIIRRNGMIDIVPIEDVVPHRIDPHTATRFTTEPQPDNDLEVWDASGWARVTCMTATWNDNEKKPNKIVHRIAARGSLFHATSDHVVFASHNGDIAEKPAGEIAVGDSLRLMPLPAATSEITLTEDEAWLLGIITAEGWVNEEGRIHVANQDLQLLDQVAACWRRVTGGTSSRYVAESGFETGEPVTQLRLTGARGYARNIWESLYTRLGSKRVPRRILNADRDTQLAFLRGYNAGDGLKSTPCTYEFQGFKTNSAALAAGLYWLAVTTLDQRAIICAEDRNDKTYYQINLNAPNVPGNKGQHLLRPLEEVVKAHPIEYHGWLFDLATTTGTFHAGIGQGWIHNSPRRGKEFVTRKITQAVARIKLGLQSSLALGNLNARRDWGYAGDYVEAMWLMLQQDTPDDYVIATGESHSVEEFVQAAFKRVGIEDWQRYVVVDQQFMRPAEVDYLLGDAAKARRQLGWQPRMTFDDLVATMVDADLAHVAAAHQLPTSVKVGRS
jgi:GDPmannose 4,6-dehydratase